MKEIFEFFKQISETYGITAALSILGLGLLGYYSYFLIKTFPNVIQSIIEKKLKEKGKEHINATKKRKNIIMEVSKVLSDLILDTGANRALLFEFSNGTSNLAGLPFLFVNATSESVSFNTSSVANSYQRINICLMADFIFELETKGYYHVDNIEEIKSIYPPLYSLFKQDGVTSATAYAIYGVNDLIGYIMIHSINGKILTRGEVLPQVAEAAQRVSALLNFDDLEEIVN